MSTDNQEMTFTPQRATQLVSNLKGILSKIDALNRPTSQPIRLVLVSKLKPASDILALHQSYSSSSASPEQDSSSSSSSTSSFRADHFGENYVQELTDKAASLPATIKWHFIGGLQSNKAKSVASIASLWCVSSVDSTKKADLLNKGREGLEALRVKVQINTSGEESKSGVDPGDAAVELCRHIHEECDNLVLSGVMTVGAIARSRATTVDTENEDFVELVKVRDDVADKLGIDKGKLELSMGMSADFEGAIVHGSNEIRVGSDIFGQRPAKQNKDSNQAEKES